MVGLVTRDDNELWDGTYMCFGTLFDIRIVFIWAGGGVWHGFKALVGCTLGTGLRCCLLNASLVAQWEHFDTTLIYTYLRMDQNIYTKPSHLQSFPRLIS